MNSEAAFVTYVPPVAILLFLLAGVHTPWDLWKVLGAGLTLIFLGLLTVARIQLGNSFSWGAEARNLVTTGVYSRVRHPVYVFSAFIPVGFALYFKMPLMAGILVFILPIQYFRARQEEKVLLQSFGKAYEDYRNSTWF